MKYCHSCGGDNRREAKYCRHCGTYLYHRGEAGRLVGHEGHSFAVPAGRNPTFCTLCGKMLVEVKK